MRPTWREMLGKDILMAHVKQWNSIIRAAKMLGFKNAKNVVSDFRNIKTLAFSSVSKCRNRTNDCIACTFARLSTSDRSYEVFGTCNFCPLRFGDNINCMGMYADMTGWLFRYDQSRDEETHNELIKSMEAMRDATVHERMNLLQSEYIALDIMDTLGLYKETWHVKANEINNVQGDHA